LNSPSKMAFNTLTVHIVMETKKGGRDFQQGDWS